MDNHCCICGAYLTDTGRMICEKCENLRQTDVKPCPRCGAVPHIGYACGEYFIVGATEGCPVCDGFTEMHSSEEQEIYVWNRRACDGSAASGGRSDLSNGQRSADAKELCDAGRCRVPQPGRQGANEKQLIDADLLLQWVEKLEAYNMGRASCFEKTKGLTPEGVRHMIGTMPKVDAVEVVRCKDCKHYDAICGVCQNLGSETMAPSDFCSYGEKKGE